MYGSNKFRMWADDAAWQKEFEKMREATVPSDRKKPRQTDYDGDHDLTVDLLASIREGGVDFCFHVWQVGELLKYEKERLRSRWSAKDEMYVVWLEME